MPKEIVMQAEQLSKDFFRLLAERWKNPNKFSMIFTITVGIAKEGNFFWNFQNNIRRSIQKNYLRNFQKKSDGISNVITKTIHKEFTDKSSKETAEV